MVSYSQVCYTHAPDLPWQSCWQPWWPCQAGFLRSSSSTGRPASSAPDYQSACSSPHLETANWEHNRNHIPCHYLQLQLYSPSDGKVYRLSCMWNLQDVWFLYLTSLPTVMAAMTFLTASFLFSFFSLFSSAFSSNISPGRTGRDVTSSCYSWSNNEIYCKYR